MRAKARDTSSIPGSGRAPGEENGNLLQYSCWEIPWSVEPRRLQSMGSPSDRCDLETEHEHRWNMLWLAKNKHPRPPKKWSPPPKLGIVSFFGTSVQFSSVAQLCLTLCNPMNRSTPGLPVHYQLPEFKLTFIESVMPSSHLILCRSLLLLLTILPSIKVFSNESTLCMRWPKYWSFSFIIIPSKEMPGLISFRMDWLDLLAVQETLKSLLQHHSSKASILRRSVFFTVQLSHSYMTAGKNHSLD